MRARVCVCEAAHSALFDLSSRAKKPLSRPFEESEVSDWLQEVSSGYVKCQAAVQSLLKILFYSENLLTFLDFYALFVKQSYYLQGGAHRILRYLLKKNLQDISALRHFQLPTDASNGLLKSEQLNTFRPHSSFSEITKPHAREIY